jgi:hypothetical protein
MTRALIAVGAALALMIGGLGLAVFVSRDEDDIGADSLLSENLTRAIGTTDRVDLTQLAPFAWDEVLVVARGTPRETISRRLGYEWTGSGDLDLGEQLIFLDGGRVARFADYRGLGRFEGFELPIDSLPRDEAVLRVRDLVVSPDRGRAR